MNRKHSSDAARPFVTLAAVTAGLADALTGTASASTPAPDLVQRSVASRQTQAPDSSSARLRTSRRRRRRRRTTSSATSACRRRRATRRRQASRPTVFGYQALAQAYESVGSTASFYTPLQLQAMALRYQAMAQHYAKASTPTKSTTSSSGIDWSDSGIGAGVGFAIALCVSGLIVLSRRNRGQQLAV